MTAICSSRLRSARKQNSWWSQCNVTSVWKDWEKSWKTSVSQSVNQSVSLRHGQNSNYLPHKHKLKVLLLERTRNGTWQYNLLLQRESWCQSRRSHFDAHCCHTDWASPSPGLLPRHRAHCSSNHPCNERSSWITLHKGITMLQTYTLLFGLWHCMACNLLQLRPLGLPPLPHYSVEPFFSLCPHLPMPFCPTISPPVSGSHCIHSPSRTSPGAGMRGKALVASRL
jgi:hypothetical protein